MQTISCAETIHFETHDKNALFDVCYNNFQIYMTLSGLLSADWIVFPHNFVLSDCIYFDESQNKSYILITKETRQFRNWYINIQTNHIKSNLIQWFFANKYLTNTCYSVPWWIISIHNTIDVRKIRRFLL
jgi:hypothetical protein